jgi:hypothetical protein
VKINEVPNWPKSVSSDGKFPRNNRSVGSTITRRPWPQWRSVDDCGGHGTEIVREQQVCPGCRGQHLLH